jgi:hypothetical protein
MLTLQTPASAARAVADVAGPNVIAAVKHVKAHTTARELITIFVNFVFIVILLSV